MWLTSKLVFMMNYLDKRGETPAEYIQSIRYSGMIHCVPKSWMEAE